jgi:hypothetical protein
MEKEFVPYELAIKLKELGFDEPCFSFYIDVDKFLYTNQKWLDYNLNSRRISAPLYQQAFRWFREKYGFEIFLKKEVNIVSGKTYSYLIENDVEEIIKRSLSKSGIERAELECLKKLIQIVKEK